MKDRGSGTVEAMIAVPAIILVLLLGMAAGRITVAMAAIEAAARDASRQASIARTAPAARAAALASATASMRSRGLNCRSVSVDVDTTGFGRPVGSAAIVTANVSCAVSLADLGFPGLPGDVVKNSQFTSPLDTYRGRR